MSCDVSLMILNHQKPGEIGALLQSLQYWEQACSFEIIVANTTAKQRISVNEAPGVTHVIDLSDNRGYGGNINQVIPHCSGRYLMALNSDTLFTGETLGKLTAHLDQHPEAGIVAPALLNSDGSRQWNARRYYSALSILYRRTFLKHIFASSNGEHLMQDAYGQNFFSADWVMGAAMAIRRDLLLPHGLFDERFFLYFEDVDLCARCQKSGYQVHCLPQVSLIHSHRRISAGLGNTFAIYHHLKSLLKFYLKYHTLAPQEKSPQNEGAA